MMRARQLIPVALAVMFSWIRSDSAPAQQPRHVVDAPGLTMRPPSDPLVNQAIHHARATVRTFIKALDMPGVNHASVKVDLFKGQGQQHERIWIINVTYSNGKFHGMVPPEEKPVYVTSVHVGDKIDVPVSQIVDWMYYTADHKLRGSYTTLVIYPQLPPNEQADVRRRTGLSDSDLRGKSH